MTDLKRRERRKNPQAPFTTSTLQQEAAKKLGFGSKRTMRLAQDLYEGVELGDEGAVGLITYMRTDSTRVSESAATHARDHLRTLFGADYLADGPRLYGDTKKNAQDAHEACARLTRAASGAGSAVPVGRTSSSSTRWCGSGSWRRRWRQRCSTRRRSTSTSARICSGRPAAW